MALNNNQPGKSPLLEFRNVTVIKEGKHIIDSITVTLQEGEHIAILGPNGAGKSSFIKTITREYYPVQREDMIFRIWGRDRWHVFVLRALLGIVSNDLQFTFTREISAREAVLSGFFSSVGLFSQEVTADMEEKTDKILEFLEISHLQDRLMTELSSGEARRFLIARALVHSPKALMLDEPTVSLDLHSLHLFRQTLRKIARSGTGIILVSHNLPDIIPEISRVILMKDGRFWKDGPKKEVLTDSNIAELFSVPGISVKKVGGYFYATSY
jgi:iron complex transport system ATP-binding protein